MKEYKLKINSNDYHVVVSGLSNGRADVMVNGQSYSVEIADAQAASDAGKPASAPAVTATAPAPAAKPAAGGAVKSPLPGVVLDIQVAVGDRVGTGQRLMILEAMKMENNIDSDRQGNQSRDGRLRAGRGRAADDRVDAAAEYLTIGNVNGPAPAGPFLTRCPCIPGFSLSAPAVRIPGRVRFGMSGTFSPA
mgnify:CR=1 FL=1